MNTVAASVETVGTAGAARVDPAWRGVYRAGGICLVGIGVAYLIGTASSMVIGGAPSNSVVYLESLAAHVRLSQIAFGLFAVADLLLVPAVLALYLALKPIARNAMLIASGFYLLFGVLDLGVTELNSLVLVSAAQQAAVAATEDQWSAALAVVAFPLATLPLATFFSYVVSSVALVITSVVMLRGPFLKMTAWAGLVAGTLGIIGGFYILVPALALLLTPCLIAYVIWLVTAGVRLARLGR